MREVQGAYLSAFCYNKNGISAYLFNKKSDEERCAEVINGLRIFNWVPKWHNIYDLKGDKEWWAVCFPELMEYNPKEAWAKMPDEMLKYIQSLPEYDEKIFKAITECE